jgi:hypothetical protein
MLSGEINFPKHTHARVLEAVRATIKDMEFDDWAVWSGDHVDFPAKGPSRLGGRVKLSKRTRGQWPGLTWTIDV